MLFQRELFLYAGFVVLLVAAVAAVALVLHGLANLATRLVAHHLGLGKDEIQRWETWVDDLDPNQTVEMKRVQRPITETPTPAVTGWRRLLPWRTYVGRHRRPWRLGR